MPKIPKTIYTNENDAVRALVENKCKDAYTFLYNKHYDVIYKLVSRYVYNPEDRIEIVADIWTQVWRKADTFQFKSLFLTWVYRISVNYCLNFLNVITRKPLYLQTLLSFTDNSGEYRNSDFVDYLKTDDVTPLDILENDIDIQLFNDTFSELSDDLQESFTRIMEGASNAEVSDLMDAKNVTVRSRTLRVRNAYRNALLLQELEADNNIPEFINLVLDLEEENLDNERVGRGMRYIKSLPDDHLEVLTLAQSGKSYKDIGEWLGLTEDQVASVLINIKDDLKKLVRLI